MNFHGGKKPGKFEDDLGSHFCIRLNKARRPAPRAGGWACAAGRPEKQGLSEASWNGLGNHSSAVSVTDGVFSLPSL